MRDMGRRVPKKLIWLAAGLIVLVLGGELLFTVLEEIVEFIVDVTQSGFMLVYEKGFGLPYEKAQGRAAWTSLGLLILSLLYAAWRLTPWIKSTSGEFRQWYRGLRNGLAELWRTAPWYQKLLFIIGGLFILSVLAMVI